MSSLNSSAGRSAKRTKIYNNSAASQLSSALTDLVDGGRQWWLWLYMAWQDIVLRYRGSVLGPLWLTLSTAIMVGTLGILYARLFEIDVAAYLPFLCLGILSWNFIVGILNEGCLAFIGAENVIRQIKLPYSTHIYRILCRNLIIFGHNIVVYIVVALLFAIKPSSILESLVGLAFILVNGAWCGLILGMLCARFRDIPLIITSLLQVAFFLTPIIWKPSLLGDQSYLAHLNPLYAFVDLFRAPLLGEQPDPISWFVASGVTVAGWIVAVLFFARFRARIPYWT